MKDNLVYVLHIAESIKKIEGYLGNISFEEFSSKDIIVSAVVRELEVIGEAASQIGDSYKDLHTGIPWGNMVAMRNRLIHEYFGVDKKIVWETCKSDLKELKVAIEPLL